MTAPTPSGRDRIGTPLVIFAVLPGVAPMVIAAGIIPFAYARTGYVGLPVLFAGLGLVLMLFSVGYLAMSRHIPNTGVLYAYVAQGLGRPLGLGAAWVALLAYSALQISLYGLVGTATNLFLGRAFGVHVAWWIAALAAWVLVAGLGLLRVGLRGPALAVLVCVEIVAVTTFAVSDALSSPAGLSVPSLDPKALLATGFGAAVVPVFLAFTGFESTTVFAETSQDPRRTVAAATYVTIFVTAILGAVSAWGLAVATGPAQVVGQSAAAAPGELLFRVADSRLPAAVVTVGAALLITSVLAALVSWQSVLRRYAAALGRERVPRGTLGVGGRRSASVAGTVVPAGLALAAIVVTATLGIDHAIRLFFEVGVSAAVGVLFLLLLTSLAVVVYFGRAAQGENVFRRLLAPGLATILLAGLMGVAAADIGRLYGPLNGWAGWLVPAAYPAVAAIGMGWAALRRRELYQSIGLGANSVTGVTIQDRINPPPYLAAHAVATTDGASAAAAAEGTSTERAAWTS